MKRPYGAGVTLASLLALGLLALLVTKTVQVRTGMEDFVVDTSKSERLGVLGKLLSSRRARTMAFVIGAEDPALHRQAAAELRRRLGESGLFAWVRGGSESSDVEAFYNLFFPPRFGLIDVPGAGELPAWLQARVLAAHQALGGGMGALVGRVLPRDPLLAFPEILRRLQEGGGGVRDNAGQLETLDGKWSVVFAQASAPALEGPKQVPVVALVEGVVADLQRASSGKVKVQWTGVNRFAVETERRIRGELGWIAVLSTAPVFLLYLLVFRSLRQFFAGLIIIGLAIGVAILACQLLFGAVHGLALTFGASLIGVTIDYAAHYSVHLAASPGHERRAMLRMLLRATTTGVVTTVAAFAAVAGGRVPVLQQIALLGVTGAVVAFVLTHLLLPRFIPPPVAAAEPAGPRRVDVLLSGLDRHRRAVMIVTSIILAGATAGLFRWRWQDNVAAFKTPLPALEAETESVQTLLGQDGQAPTVVVTGPNDERALALHEQVVARLTELTKGAAGTEPGAISGFASVQSVLVSAGTQRARRERLAADLEAPYRAALTRAGFQPSAFPPWQKLLADSGPPLQPAQVAASPVAFLLDSWRIELDAQKVGYLIALRGVRNEAGVAAALEAFPGVFMIRPAGLLEETYALFRDRMLRWLGVGTALVILIMIVVYRSATFVFAGVLPAALGAAATLGLLAWLGIAGNVLHVVGLVLVLGLGVDYGVYLVEAREGSIGLSIRGILLGAATTCISFGALAASRNAAVHTLGLTSAIGIVFTTITCPLVIFLVQGTRKAKA
jgi:predicted exporter